jgi:hypothetical protein
MTVNRNGLKIAAILVVFVSAAGVWWTGCAADVVTPQDGGKRDGSRPADSGDEEDGGVPLQDAGDDASADGGEADGGGSDAATDGGKDGGVKDGGFWKPGVIRPGMGVDIYLTPDAGSPQMFRVMQNTLYDLDQYLGTGTANPDNKWIRSYDNWALDAVFVDSTDEKNPENPSNLLQGFILNRDFNGKTTAGHGPGDTRKNWQTELSTPEYTYIVPATSTTDVYYTKGVSVVYVSDVADKIAVYRKQKVDPKLDIDWKTLSVYSIKASLLSGATSFSTVTTTLGEPDQTTTYVQKIGGNDVTLEARYYISLGLTFWGEKSAAKVNTIVITAPYHGKLINTAGLMLGSAYSDIKTFFSTQTTQCVDSGGSSAPCTEKTAEYTAPNTGEKFTVYYYWIHREIVTYYMSVGFIYGKDGGGDPDKLGSIILGYPAQ